MSRPKSRSRSSQCAKAAKTVMRLSLFFMIRCDADIEKHLLPIFQPRGFNCRLFLLLNVWSRFYMETHTLICMVCALWKGGGRERERERERGGGGGGGVGENGGVAGRLNFIG